MKKADDSKHSKRQTLQLEPLLRAGMCSTMQLRVCASNRDHKGVLLEYYLKGSTVTSASYFDTLIPLQKVIKS